MTDKTIRPHAHSFPRLDIERLDADVRALLNLNPQKLVDLYVRNHVSEAARRFVTERPKQAARYLVRVVKDVATLREHLQWCVHTIENCVETMQTDGADEEETKEVVARISEIRRILEKRSFKAVSPPPPPRMENGAWVRLEDLPTGAIFETKDGVKALKTEYHYDSGVCMAVLLASGEYAHFKDKNETLVREIDV